MATVASRLPTVPFELEFDERARTWLDKHPGDESLVIGFEVHRCCRGMGVCNVRMRRGHPGERFRSRLVPIGEVAGREVLLDPRIVEAMPRRIPVTVGGVGPFKGLRLDLSGDEWGRLLYE
ncbi:MAG TPA: hypothetical protein VI316_08295 [Candidatus Dormibacteraeota bacterium]